MNKFKKFLNILAALTSGMLLSSLWITHSNSWEIYLPICLVCIIFNQTLKEES